jgi:hypothetical protein
MVLYKKTTSHNLIKFITVNYLQMYKTLQLFTSLFTEITNRFANAKVIEMPSLLKLGLIKTVYEV